MTRAAAAAQADDLGFKLMRKGVKEAASDSILTPRFYTTDFEQMEEMFRCKASASLRVLLQAIRVSEFCCKLSGAVL